MNSFEMELALSGQIAAAVARNGGRACYVGGFVRDGIMGVACKDIDIEVYGIPPQKLREVLAELGDVYDKGASFGVLGAEVKNRISHRARALAAFRAELERSGLC